MNCLYCTHNKTEVVETRDSGDGDVVRRRRECPSCSRRFTTYEKPERFDLNVVKKNDVVEEFDREKLRESLYKATKGQDITELTLINLTDKIEKELLAANGSKVNTMDIARTILRKLYDLDEVAFLRFASYQYDVESIEDLEKLKEKVISDLGL